MIGLLRHSGRATLSAVLAGGLLSACSSDAAVPQTGTSPVQAGSAATTSSLPGAAAGSGAMQAPAMGMNGAAPTQAGSAQMPSMGAAGSGAAAEAQTQTQTQTAGGGVTYCNVKATFTTRCTVCHNEQHAAGAPMSLLTYADLQAPAVSDNSLKVYEMVEKRIHDPVKPMPPQQTLTADELANIDAWIAGGAPEGPDPTCDSVPGANAPATKPAQEWPSNCDATYKVLSHGSGGPNTPYMIGAGEELHPQVTIPAPWGNEEVQMIAWRAVNDNPKVLHHWILYGSQREFLVGWAPGKDSNVPLPDDVGLHLSGGNLTLDMHYNNLMGTTEEGDNSGVEMCVLTKDHFRPKTATVYMGFSQFAISIPAHATNFDVTGECTINSSEPITLLSASPHAHYMGRHMKFTVERANGETVTMLDHAFDFNEQGTYPLDPPVTLNNGDKVITTCTYDNTSDSTVTFGENTENEMCFNFAVYYPMNAFSCSGGFLPGGGFPGFGGN